jgi:hypothetical protein
VVHRGGDAPRAGAGVAGERRGGRALPRLSAADLAALDRFEDEGETYRRIRVPVEVDGGERVEAWTYLFLHAGLVLPDPWEPAAFEAGGLRRFLDAYCRRP